MDRRAFIGTLAGGLLAAPLGAEGQHPGRVPRVGYLVLGDSSNPVTSSVRNLFKEALRDEGYIEAQDVEIVDRYEADLAGLRNAAKDLVRLNVDVIVAGGTAGGLAARQATNTIPIVAGSLADPVADGLVASLARPGGNITGNTFLAPQLGPKRLQLLQEVVPRIKRLAALQHPRVYSELTMRTMATELDEIAKASGIELRIFSAAGPDEFDDAFAAMVQARASALVVFPSPMFYLHYRRLVELSTRHRLPTMYVSREAVEAGGLMCYGANIPDLFRHAAGYVAKILRGAKPADLPIEQPTKFELFINLKTAKALGLTIPPSLLQRADRVIE